MVKKQLAPVLALSIATAVSALCAAEPREGLELELIEAGEGWSLRRLGGSMDGDAILSRNLVFATGEEGIQNAPLPAADRDAMLDDLAGIAASRPSLGLTGNPAPRILYMVDKDLAEGLAAGLVPPRFLPFLDPGPGNDLGDGCGIWSPRSAGGSFQHSDDRVRSVERRFENTILDPDDNSEIGYTAFDVTARIAPLLVADLVAEIRYAFLTSSQADGCVPYIVRFDEISFSLDLALEQETELAGNRPTSRDSYTTNAVRY